MYNQEFIEFLHLVDDFIERAGSTVWFRGHGSVNYKLNSGLFRLDTNDIEEIIQIETQLYNHFLAEGGLLNGDSKEWELLYTMQHFGARTRLLDWTSSLSVALFFASISWKEDKVRIWLLDPIRLNKMSRGHTGILSPYHLDFSQVNELENTVAIYPIKNSQRINAQHGFFTLQGNSMQSLDKEFEGELLEEGILKCLDLSKELRGDLYKFLSLSGVNNFSVFPDLEGLAKQLNISIIKPSLLVD
jgi:hypothetical protein